MISGQQGRRSRLGAFAAWLFVVLVLALPVLVGMRDNESVLRGAVVLAASRDSFELTTPIKFSAAPGLTVANGTISFAPEQSSAAASGEKAAALLAKGEGRLVLNDATLSFDASETGRNVSRSDTEELNPDAIAPLVSALWQLSFETLTINRSTIVIRNGNRAADFLTNVKADIICKRKQSLRAKGTFDLNGQQVAFEATLGMGADRKVMSQYPLRASLKAPLLQVTLDGRLSLADGFRLQATQAEVTSPNLRQTVRWLGAVWPGNAGFDEFRARGELDWTERAIAFQKATFEMNGNVATGTLSLVTNGSRPSLEGTLALKSLDLNRYLPARVARNIETGTVTLTAASAPLGVVLPLISSVEADLRVSADRVMLGTSTIGRSAATVSLRGGKLLADIAELELDGTARGSGQLSVDMNGVEPRLLVRGKLEAVELGAPTTALFGHPTLQGRADLTVDLSASGDSQERLTGTLAGKIALGLPEGGQIGVDTGSLLTGAKARDLAGWNSGYGRGSTSVEQLDMRLLLNAGLLRIDSAKAYDGSTGYSAGGTVDLLQRSLDLRLSVVQGLSEDRSPASGATREVLHVKGDWDAPLIRFLPTAEKASLPRPAHEMTVPEPLMPAGAPPN